MERLAKKRPGYDCKNAPCQHTPKGDHGIHCEDWIFAAKDGDCALVLMVSSGVYPATVPEASIQQIRSVVAYPYAADLSLHAAFRTDADEAGSECGYVDGGRCFGNHSTGIGAERFWSEHGHPAAGFDQPESFWRALESECRSWAADHRERRLAPGDEHVDCPRCSGSGKVAAKTVPSMEPAHA